MAKKPALLHFDLSLSKKDFSAFNLILKYFTVDRIVSVETFFASSTLDILGPGNHGWRRHFSLVPFLPFLRPYWHEKEVFPFYYGKHASQAS